MLIKKEIGEFREALKTSKRPIFFFDDDADGLCSFILLYKFCKGFAEDIKGIAAKSGPELKDEMYIRKIEEFNPDKVFILDKPIVSQDFIDMIHIPVYWLDHHPLLKRTKINYFNPLKHKTKKYPQDNRPTSYWAYKISGRENDLWLAMVGCVADYFLPDISKEFSKKYPEILPKNSLKEDPGKILHATRLGTLCRIIQFNVKGPAKTLSATMKILTRIEYPEEILDQATPQGRFIFNEFEKINNVYEKVKKDIPQTEDNFIVYIYEDPYSLSQDLATEVSYENPDKFIIIARHKNDEMKCCLRSQNNDLRKVLENALVGINGHGGGHMHACGAGVNVSDFDRFIENMRKYAKEETGNN